MNVIKLIICFFSFGLCCSHFAQSQINNAYVKNVIFCVQDSIEYNENSAKSIADILLKKPNENFLFCYMVDNKLNHMIVNSAQKDTLINLFPSLFDLTTHNKSLIFDFLLVFEKYLDPLISDTIDFNLYLSTNNVSKFFVGEGLSSNSIKSRTILNEIWNNISLVTGYENTDILNKRVFISQANNTVVDSLQIKNMANKFSSKITITTL